MENHPPSEVRHLVISEGPGVCVCVSVYSPLAVIFRRSPTEPRRPQRSAGVPVLPAHLPARGGAPRAHQVLPREGRGPEHVPHLRLQRTLQGTDGEAHATAQPGSGEGERKFATVLITYNISYV